MNRDNNHQLQFFIRLTGILGRAFTDLQQLLTSELRRQQQDISNKEINYQQKTLNHAVESNNNHGQLLELPIQRKENIKEYESEEPYIPKEEKKLRKVKKFKKNKIRIIKTKAKKIHYKLKPKIKKKLKEKKKPLEGKPSPPLNAFMLFLKQKKYQIMTKRPELSPSQVSIYASTIWNSYNDTQKFQYIQKYRKNHEIYLQQLKKYRSIQRQIKQNESDKQLRQNRKSQIQYENVKRNCIENRVLNLRSNIRHRIQRRRKIQSNQIINIESQQENPGNLKKNDVYKD